MPDDEGTRRWQRMSWPSKDADPIHALRTAIHHVRKAPRDEEARRRLRALAAEQGSWEQLALLLNDEARASVEKPELAAAFYEELADVYENLDQPLETITAMEAVIAFEPNEVEHHDRLAWLYRKAGAAVKAAQAFEQVGKLSRDERGRAALRAAGRLYRESGKLDQAIAVYHAIVERKPSDAEAWRALDEILTEQKRWYDVAAVRGEMAKHANGVDKAVMLRSQARALEQAGDVLTATELVASAAQHAPEDVSGLVDYATVLAREGRAGEAADVLRQRIDDAVRDGAPTMNIAALRLRLVDVLDGAGDRAGAQKVLDGLLAELPEHVAALEKLVQFGSQDSDPRVHAEALLRLAAATEGPEGIALVTEAARRYRAAGDLRRAAHSFERAAELSPDDEALAQELQDAQTALVVEIAAAEASAGDTQAAERRLRQILGNFPMHVDANLALADLLVATNRAQQAIDHLRDTLADAPEETEHEVLAKLVHRTASITRTLGDLDEAHQLLHEAHHLDRKDLRITLALGESCFTRKLWREAAIHLGGLADHPDAGKHRAPVAAGLVRAGQAEVRALKPQNAPKHYEAAVRVDPECAPAWHALAELATEAGDMVRAAECLEREASATKDPDTRLRLYDALGDLALEVLGDPERAERCWARVSSMLHAPVLEKLLALQRKRGSNIERGETCERLAAVTADERTKKQLSEEAAEAFAAGNDLARALAVAEWLINTHPHDVDTVSCASKVALASSRYDLAAGWLRRALTTWDSAGNRGDGDKRRAELWRRLGDAEKGRANERAALEAYQRAVVTAPESDGALAARRGLIELAASFGRSANTSRLVLVEHEQNPDDIIELARSLANSRASREITSARSRVSDDIITAPRDREDPDATRLVPPAPARGSSRSSRTTGQTATLSRADEIENARALYELARAIGVELLAEDEQFLDQHATRPMASDEAYATVLEEDERRQLIDDVRDSDLAEILLLLGEAANLVCLDAKTAVDKEALFDARRVAATSDAAAVAMYPQIAKALNGPATLLYSDPTRNAPDVRLLLASPPVLVLGPRLSALRARSRSDAELDADTELRFRLGRVVELARPHRLFAAGTDRETFAKLVAGVWHAFGRADVEPPKDIAREAERLHHAVPVNLRRRLNERMSTVTPADLDVEGYIAACERAADRAGLIACGHTGIAIHLAGGADRAKHLVQVASSQKYLAARRKLRRR